MADGVDRDVARVARVAREAVAAGVPHDQGVERVRAVTDDAYILGIAAGVEFGAWLAATSPYGPAVTVVELLEAAGADRSVRDRVAADLMHRAATPVVGFAHVDGTGRPEPLV